MLQILILYPLAFYLGIRLIPLVVAFLSSLLLFILHTVGNVISITWELIRTVVYSTLAIINQIVPSFRMYNFYSSDQYKYFKSYFVPNSDVINNVFRPYSNGRTNKTIPLYAIHLYKSYDDNQKNLYGFFIGLGINIRYYFSPFNSFAQRCSETVEECNKDLKSAGKCITSITRSIITFSTGGPKKDSTKSELRP